MKTTARYQEWLSGVKHLMVDVNTKQKQVDMAGKIKITPVYLNAVLRGRRVAAPLTQDKISQALGYDYDTVRHVGRLALGMPPLNQSVSQTGINNGSVPGVFVFQKNDTFYPVSGDIARELCKELTDIFNDLDIDNQILLRAKIKSILKSLGNNNGSTKSA